MKVITTVFFACCLTKVFSELECSFDTTPFDEGSVVEPVSVSSLDLNAYSGSCDEVLIINVNLFGAALL